MSLKPRKISDINREQQKLNDKMKKKLKDRVDDLPPYMFIVSEGIKTEIFYIKGFSDAINKKYSDFSTSDRIQVMGTGRNCRSLLSYAREQVLKIMPQAEIVWLMYDKDDFPFDDFDNTQFSAEQREHTDTAIMRAKKQYEEFEANTPPSRRCPATRVFELVEELKKFL